MRRLLLLVFSVMCIVSGSAFWGGAVVLASPGPTEELKPILQKMVAVICDPTLAGNGQRVERRKKIMAIAVHAFDFTEMSKRVLGRTWRKIDQGQRDDFEELFTKLLENAYIGKLEQFSGQEIVYSGERIKGKKAAVSTVVTSNDSAPFPVSYVMLKNAKGWQVYDINIEGVSLLRNYREQFRSILRKEKFSGLVEVLHKKNASFTDDGEK